MFRKFFTLFGTIGILAAGVFLIGAMGAMRPRIAPQAPTITPPTVFYMTAVSRAVTLDVYAQGEVRPRTDITLTAEVSGRIVATSPAFVDGGAFMKGELLVKIEDADYRLAVTSARARVAQAEESLKREEAESILARRDYEDLGRKGDPSELTLRLPQLAQAKAAFEGARADYRSAELDLERTGVTAPFQGRVRNRLAGEGQFVGPGAQLGRIFSTDVVEVRLALADSDLAKLDLPIAFIESAQTPGPPVLFSAAVGGGVHHWRGRIARTDGAIDPATRQISAIAVVEDPYGAGADSGTPFAVGLFVDARIEGKPLADAIVAPRTALYGRDAVYVVGPDDTISKRIVVVASSDRESIVIVGGLQAGERIVTSPLRGADEGDKVVPVDPLVADPADPADPTEEIPPQGSAATLASGDAP